MGVLLAGVLLEGLGGEAYRGARRVVHARGSANRARGTCSPQARLALPRVGRSGGRGEHALFACGRTVGDGGRCGALEAAVAVDQRGRHLG